MREAAEIVDPKCGALTEPGDAEAVAAALRNLIPGPLMATGAGGSQPDPGGIALGPRPSTQRRRAPSPGGGEA